MHWTYCLNVYFKIVKNEPPIIFQHIFFLKLHVAYSSHVHKHVVRSQIDIIIYNYEAEIVPFTH